MHGVREHPDFLLLFIAEEAAQVLTVAAPNFHSQHQCGRVPFALHPLQHLLLVEFPSMAVLAGVRLYIPP